MVRMVVDVDIKEELLKWKEKMNFFFENGKQRIQIENKDLIE